MRKAILNSLVLITSPLAILVIVSAWVAWPVSGIVLVFDGAWYLILLGILTTILLPYIYIFLKIKYISILYKPYRFIIENTNNEGLLYKISISLIMVIAIVFHIALILLIILSVYNYIPYYSGISVEGKNYIIFEYFWYPEYSWSVLLWCHGIISGAFSYILSKESSDNHFATFFVIFISLISLIICINFSLQDIIGWEF
ncbi:hypothetical protein [Fodinicurvata fenggangensis]|uniref:hypothetical protein n=1 Tax=Fodinicurvata fenggangensis TaxID=1121830 RepID=UPI0012DF42F9|nr:hypothetical protein [Fodinicurvata fenggangensis]